MQTRVKRMRKLKSPNTSKVIFGLTVLFLAAIAPTNYRALAQQLPDMEFQYIIKTPAYEKGMGPTLLIDKAHSPYLKRGFYDPFQKLVRSDGFQAKYLETKITENALDEAQILVVINAYRKTFAKFPLLQPPSAYEPDEIAIIKNWVTRGGRLLMIADHAPFAGGTNALAEAFGFTYFNGYVFEGASLPFGRGEIKFRKATGLNLENPVIRGNFIDEDINRFQTFTGTAFIPAIEAEQLLTLPNGYVAVMTHSIRHEIETAPRINVSGLSQGSTLVFGSGKLAVFAEAASFTALTISRQNQRTKYTGMNHPKGAKNPLLILATMRWLADGL